MAVSATPLDPLALAAPAPVIPVIVLQRLDDAVPLARALVAGGIRVLEVTLRTPAAIASAGVNHEPPTTATLASAR